jgi:hypothetical protein
MKLAPGHLARKVEQVVAATEVDDIHTHLYDPAFGELLLWGIDDLLTYHYLIAENFRVASIPCKEFWELSKTEQAALIWKNLFIQHSPISEACRGILTTLNRLGLDVKKRDLKAIRKWFAQQKPGEYTTRCMELAGVESICMTNSPFDRIERQIWDRKFDRDPRFKAALRIDPLVLAYTDSAGQLLSWAYKVKPELNAKTLAQLRRFLEDWTRRIQPQFVMVSLPPEFTYPDASDSAQIIEKAILPHCLDFNLPFAVMPGVRRGVNPNLRLAGDGSARVNMNALQNLCAANPKSKFLCTILPRENQHELCVLARKFRNLHIFGCWWFMNIPSLIEEITRMRLELLGTSFTAQHSDARVLDQIIYKWDHSRKVITRVLVEKYQDLAATGWTLTSAEIERDVRALFGGSYQDFLKLEL